MLEGTHEFIADGPDYDDRGDGRFLGKAIAWGGTELSEPAVHSYGIRIELRASSDPNGAPVAQFSIPLETAKAIGLWLAGKADSLSR